MTCANPTCRREPNPALPFKTCERCRELSKLANRRRHGWQGRRSQVEAFDFGVDQVAQIVDDDDPRAGTIPERAARFHARNPAVYRYAVSVARYVKRRGLMHYGIGAVWEIMRFKYLETHGDLYKLNNNHRAWYARQIMAQEPDLAGFFTIREGPHDEAYHARSVE